MSLTAHARSPPAAAVHPPPNRLCIDNLFEKRWDPISGAYSEANLKFKKMPLGEAAPQTGDQRRRQVRRRAERGLECGRRQVMEACIRTRLAHPAAGGCLAGSGAAVSSARYVMRSAVHIHPQVTIIHFDGREKPTTYGVEVCSSAA